MKLSDFDYQLPKELIAQYPLKKRDSAKLLVLDRHKGTFKHRIFKDIADYLNKDDLLVLNDTKVLPARLKGARTTGGRVEALLLNRKGGLTFNALIKPSRLRYQEKIIFNGQKICGALTGKNELTFYARDIKEVYGSGKMPLPPYIKREPQKLDDLYYQTVYAKKEGAIAAPTAGLHFTKASLAQIKSRGIKTAYLTLHVGYGTFRPVKTEDIRQHKMEKEEFIIPAKTLMSIRAAKTKGKRIFAVGTTALRAMETCADSLAEYGRRNTDDGIRTTEYSSSTNLFIYPGYKFKITDALLTNFHLPRTTLFILVCAFAGEKLIKAAYKAAIEKKYRFYSYGDAMLIV
jgi:S-adenosylmethionine:tRNA ribosyltransferase-isomerase